MSALKCPSGVRWISPKPGTGYGDSAVAYLSALESLGIPVTWTPLEWIAGREVPVSDYRGPLAHLVERNVEHDTVVVHIPPGDHRRWLDEAASRRRLLYTTWETDRPPQVWGNPWGEFDSVLVPTTFNRDALVSEAAGVVVHVVPHCARRSEGGVPASLAPAYWERVGDRFVFYTIGSWTTRKAMADTVTAFVDAFDADDDVALVVKTGRDDIQAVRRQLRGQESGLSARWQASTAAAVAALVAGRRRPPELLLIPADVGPSEVDALHVRGDCFYSLTRSEGWGLCISDALLFGNPVVVTGWGGQLDYLGSDYPLLVDYDLVPTSGEVPDGWFQQSEDRFWARARRDDAVDRLRWVADNRESAAAIGAGMGVRVGRDYSPDVVGRILLDALSTD